MKTSNKLFLSAVVLLLGSLGAYNAALSAAYRAGNYKNPFYGYTALPLTGFSEVAVPAFSRFSVKVVNGPYSVHLNDDAAKYVHISQQGQRLTVALAYPEKEENLGNRETVLISCPQLRQLTADASATVAGKRGNSGGQVVIMGLRQDSLLVNAARDISVELEGNALGQLRAVLASGSRLELDKTNRIEAAKLAIGANCYLEQECRITQPRYQFSNTATARFEGMAAQRIGQ